MFNLMVAITCGVNSLGIVKVDKWVESQGVAYCNTAQNEKTKRLVKITLPPNKGTVSAMNRDALLSFFDFNTNFEEKGFLFWKSARLNPSDDPIV